MSFIPDDLEYTREHTWKRDEGDGTFSIGITDYGQEKLGEFVFVELPEVGRRMMAGEAVGVVESVSDVLRVQTPRAGEVVATNPELDSSPELLNSDPYGEGWLFRIMPEDGAPTHGVIDAATYGEMFG
ncbi:glycine cleavage system protein GcvH [Streptomyces sp. NPDC006435]|uniref:glycine cleavage system protein GcvH n=1 Tax=Streptomyces sp. NPDC006435 TaxID=3154300 RepID=UPI0033B034EA